MAPLKLAKLPDRETAKVTFTANAELVMPLNEYAAAYEREYGRKEAVANLIPPMLEAFIRSDRGFRIGRKESGMTTLETGHKENVNVKDANSAT